MTQPAENGSTTTDVVESPGQDVPAGTDNEDNSSSSLTHEQALAELSKVRKEAADRRIKLRDAEEKAKKWEEFEESQKSELQKLQDSVAERDRKLAEKELEITRSRIAREFDVAEEDLDLLVGDEDNMKRLAKRLGKPTDGSPPKPADLLAGNRGKPLGGSSNTFSMDDFIRGSVK